LRQVHTLGTSLGGYGKTKGGRGRDILSLHRNEAQYAVKIVEGDKNALKKALPKNKKKGNKGCSTFKKVNRTKH